MVLHGGMVAFSQTSPELFLRRSLTKSSTRVITINDIIILSNVLRTIGRSYWNYIIYGPQARNKKSYHRLIFPLIISLFVIISASFGYLLISAFLFNPSLNSSKHMTLASILFILFVYLMTYKLHQAVICLYYSTIGLLSVAPIPPRVVFLATLLEKPLFKAKLLLFNALVAAFAWCVFSPSSWAVFVTTAIGLPLYFSLAFAFRSFLVILGRACSLTKIIRLQKISSKFIFIIALFGLAELTRNVGLAVSRLLTGSVRAGSLLSSIESLNPAILFLGKAGLSFPPSNWMAKSFVLAANKYQGRSILWLLPLLLLSCAFWVSIVFLAQLTLERKVVSHCHEPVVKAPIKQNERQRFLRLLTSLLPLDLHAVAVKDITLLLRQKELLFRDIAKTMIAVFIIIGALSGINASGILRSFMPPFYYLVLTGLTGFVFAATILPYAGIDSEGKCFGIFQASPVDLKYVLLVKFLIFYTIVVSNILLVSLVASALLGIPADQIIIGLILNSIMLLAICGISFGISAIFPRFDWELPSQAGSSLLSIYMRQLLMQAYIFIVGVIGFFSIENRIGSSFGFKPFVTLPSLLFG